MTTLKLSSNRVRHLNSITHEGKVLVFATAEGGGIWYTVKQDGFEDSSLKAPSSDTPGWEKWAPLMLVGQPDDVSVTAREKAELSYQADPTRLVARSVYKAPTTAVGPVQLVSALGHLYVFRQSKAGTLLVDRFVLDGMTNQLNPKLEVRFKRSRQRNTPIATTAAGQPDMDSLDFRDANENPFIEPTTELSLIGNLVQGWFSVVLVPTAEHDVYRWHIFAYNNFTQKVEIITLRASDEGLFDVKDYTLLEDVNGVQVPRSIPGILRRSLDIQDFSVTNGLAATRYDLQSEQQLQGGETQLLKTASRVLLAIPGASKGMPATAAFSFSIATDGTLSQVGEKAVTTTVRATQQEVLLPPSTLDDVKAFADKAPAPQGAITGFAAGTAEQDAEDRVTFTTTSTAALQSRDQVKVSGTSDYQGLYTATKVDADTFKIKLPSSPAPGGWEKEQAATGLLFNGKITGYRQTAPNELTVICPGHGLESGDPVQMSGTSAYNETYSVKVIDATHFAIDATWPFAEGVNLKLLSMQRRGVVLDGKSDKIELPKAAAGAVDPLDLTLRDFTAEFWVYLDESPGAEMSLLRQSNFPSASADGCLQLVIRNQKPYLGFSSNDTGGNTVLLPKKWYHLAFRYTSATKEQAIFVNGALDAASLNHNPLKGKDALVIGEAFKGQLADVRIWKQARSADAIRNNMFLQLTGDEEDLAGYYRLGAIVEGKVLDFSRNHLDGAVKGNPYVSAVTLPRELAPGKPAVKYGNADVYAVRQHATYEESFEFKVTSATPVDVNDADGSGNPIFSLSYWGKISRSAEAQTVIPAAQDKLQDPGDGWYRAAARFTVPDDVNLVRCFELGAVKGTWQSVEVRKHRLRLLSDSITEATYTDSCSPSMLPDGQGALLDQIAEAEAKEDRLAALSAEKRELESKIALYDAQATSTAERNHLRDIEIPQWEKKVADANANPLNYWCCVTFTPAGSGAKAWTWPDSYLPDGNGSPVGVKYKPPVAGNLQQWVFEPTGRGTCTLKNREHQDACCTPVTTSDGFAVFVASPGSSPSEWNVDPDGKGGYLIKSVQRAAYCYYWDLNGTGEASVGVGSRGDTLNHWTLVATADKTAAGTSEIARLTKELNDKRARKAELDVVLNSNDKDNDAWKARLTQVNASISSLETELNALSTAFINGVKAMNKTPQAMPQVAKDSRGLSTSGALLGFVNPMSRLSALETCEGNVQLSYFDTRGRMRLTNFDVTADGKNATFEEWIPDGERVCVNFKSNSQAALAKPRELPQDHTIEAWFSYPLPQSPFCSLASGDQGHHVMVSGNKDLGIYTGNLFPDQNFYGSGFDMSRLAPGWHHLAAVTKGKTTRFYIDGQYVGDTLKRAQEEAKSAVETAANDAAKKREEDLKNAYVTLAGTPSPMRSPPKIGFFGGRTGSNDPSGDLSFGKVAELRIWGVALSDEEIAVNSKTLLSGREPDLLAYYPMNEADGDKLRDRTGNPDNDATATGTWSWWVCSAAIGKPGSLAELDGAEGPRSFDFVPPLTEATHEFWFKTSNPETGLFSVAKGDLGATGNDRDLYLTGGNIKARIYNNEAISSAGLTLNDGKWHHVAHVFGASVGGQKLYVDGALVASGSKKASDFTWADCVYAGYSRDAGHKQLEGKIANVRIWGKAHSKAEVQADMSSYMIDADPDLVGRWLDVVDSAASRHDVVPPPTEATHEFWFKTSNPETGLFVVAKGDLGAAGSDRDLYLKGGNIVARIYNNETISSTGPKLHDGKWHHVAHVFGASVGGQKLYVDGVLVASGVKAASDFTWADRVHVGYSVDAGQKQLQGQICGVRIWGKAHSEAQIQVDISRNTVGYEPDLWNGWSDVVDSTVSSHEVVPPLTEVTHEFWFKTSHPETGLFVVAKGDLGAAGSDRDLYLKGGNIVARIYNNEVISSSGLKLADGRWHHVAHVFGASVGGQKLYVDGVLVASGVKAASDFTWADRVHVGYSVDAGTPLLQGQISRVRIWKKAWSLVDLRARVFKDPNGNELALLSRFDRGPCPDSVISNEHGSVIVDPGTGQASPLMCRFFAYPGGDGAELLPSKRVETLEQKWIGNAQFNPTLLGFIEGAPPVPSENLTEEDDYSGATSVELTASDDVAYSWSRSQELGGAASASLFAGLELQADAGGSLGATYIQKVAEVRAGVSVFGELSGSTQSQTSISSSSSSSMTDRLELRGAPEVTVKFPHLGKRFVPKNVGYALVVSALADVFVTRLSRSRKMIGYQVKPVKDIPPDVSTITFMMNPAYTMNGSLDGMTGSSATSDRFHRQVPSERARYGSLYPASYYRPGEAYGRRAKIDAEDKRRESYFANFNAGLIDEVSLDLEITTPPLPGSASKDSAGQSQADLAGANEANKEKLEAIDNTISDANRKAQASTCFQAWQRKMEDIQIRAGKRNIVNTYVWDADGGLRAEAQSFASTVEHSIGGSFSLSVGAGIELRAFVVVAALELQAQASFNMTQTMSKTLSTSRGLALNVDLGGVEHRGITDYKDRPLLPGEKVDRYRFMSFYLEGDTSHFHDFFNEVVDPEWLAGNGEEARALRQAKAGKPNKAWRVLHRVTLVERPALSAFGQDVRNLRPPTEISDTKEILSRVADLESRNDAMDDKLDRILALLKK